MKIYEDLTTLCQNHPESGVILNLGIYAIILSSSL